MLFLVIANKFLHTLDRARVVIKSCNPYCTLIDMNLLNALMILLLSLFLAACGAAVSGWVGNDCYECVDTPCDCAGDGYGGPYNPKALDLYRPGRFEDLDSPGF